jgi:ribosomal-protein-alanine N-acetyltransferase
MRRATLILPTGDAMTKEVPTLNTARLIIRPYTMDDLDNLHRLFDAPEAESPGDTPLTLAERRAWLQWMTAQTGKFAGWYAPYGDRAVVLRDSNTLIGAVGFVPELEPFESLPALGGNANALCTCEISLFWAIGTAYRRQGYASEAAQALVDYAFKVMRVRRLLALTHPDNLASLGVMRRLGMYIERAQGACGILENTLPQQ